MKTDTQTDHTRLFAYSVAVGFIVFTVVLALAALRIL